MAEPTLEDMSDLMDSRTLTEDVDNITEQAEREAEREAELLAEHREEERESKAALRALIADTVAEDSQEGMHDMHEVEVDFERREVSGEKYLFFYLFYSDFSLLRF